eukprot:tig00000388_g24783.t1
MAVASLVPYTCSDEEEEVPRPVKRSRSSPALPSPQLESRAPPIDPPAPLPAAHDGRVRTFPHVVGNYPSYVYIPVRVSDELVRLVHSALDRVRAALSAGAADGSGPPEVKENTSAEYHVSVSRTFVLRREQIAPFVASLRKAMRNTARYKAALSGVEFFTNEEQTRSFVSIPIRKGLVETCSIIKAVDEVMQAYELRPFYPEPRPHVTVAWALGASLGKLQLEAPAEAGSVGLPVNRVEAKIGNRVYDFILKHSQDTAH